MVAPEVGEDGDVEDDPVDPAHHQGVARHLHRAGRHAALAHHREQAVQVGGLRRGQRGLHVGAGDPGADGADRRRTGRRPAAARSRPAGWSWSCPGCRSRRSSAAPRPGRRRRGRRGGPAARAGRSTTRSGTPRAPAASAPVGVGEDRDGARGDRGRRRTRCRGRGRPGRAAYRSPGRIRCELSESPVISREPRSPRVDTVGVLLRQPGDEVGERRRHRVPRSGPQVVAHHAARLSPGPGPAGTREARGAVTTRRGGGTAWCRWAAPRSGAGRSP